VRLDGLSPALGAPERSAAADEAVARQGPTGAHGDLAPIAAATFFGAPAAAPSQPSALPRTSSSSDDLGWLDVVVCFELLGANQVFFCLFLSHFFFSIYIYFPTQKKFFLIVIKIK